MNGDFDRVWGLTSQALLDADPGARDELLGGTASRLYRFKNSPPEAS